MSRHAQTPALPDLRSSHSRFLLKKLSLLTFVIVAEQQSFLVLSKA
jgi:hypothetical protein